MPALQMDELRQKIGLISTFLKVTLVHRNGPAPDSRAHVPDLATLQGTSAQMRPGAQRPKHSESSPGSYGSTGVPGPALPREGGSCSPAALFVLPGSGPGFPQRTREVAQGRRGDEGFTHRHSRP